MTQRESREPSEEQAAKVIAVWLGIEWDGLETGRIADKGLPVWTWSGYGGKKFQGRQGDLIDLARALLSRSPVPSEEEIARADAWRDWWRPVDEREISDGLSAHGVAYNAFRAGWDRRSALLSRRSPPPSTATDPARADDADHPRETNSLVCRDGGDLGDKAGDADGIEAIAQWLHDEVDYPDPDFPNRSWPEHPDDTGQREDGWLKIIPKDVQEQFREIAVRFSRQFVAPKLAEIERQLAEVARRDAVIATARREAIEKVAARLDTAANLLGDDAAAAVLYKIADVIRIGAIATLDRASADDR